MKPSITRLLLFVSLALCCPQEPWSSSAIAGQKAMEVFGQRTFDEHKTSGHYAYRLPDGSEVEEWEAPGKYYLQEVRKGRTNYSTYRMFHFGSKRLMKKGEQFFKFPIGIWRTYNEAGVATEEVDHEQAFKVSVQELEKMMADRGVNISVRGNGVGVLREQAPAPTYTVFFPDASGDDSTVRFVGIDGVTGKIVSQMVRQRTKD